MSNSVIFIIPRGVSSLDGDDIAFFIVKIGREVQSHADGGKDLVRDLAFLSGE